MSAATPLAITALTLEAVAAAAHLGLLVKPSHRFSVAETVVEETEAVAYAAVQDAVQIPDKVRKVLVGDAEDPLLGMTTRSGRSSSRTNSRWILPQMLWNVLFVIEALGFGFMIGEFSAGHVPATSSEQGNVLIACIALVVFNFGSFVWLGLNTSSRKKRTSNSGDGSTPNGGPLDKRSNQRISMKQKRPLDLASTINSFVNSEQEQILAQITEAWQTIYSMNVDDITLTKSQVHDELEKESNFWEEFVLPNQAKLTAPVFQQLDNLRGRLRSSLKKKIPDLE